MSVGDGNLGHLLIVDDDERLRMLLSRFLVKNGFLVSTAASAGEAEKSLRHLCYDLIVLDVMLPDQSGVNLTKSLRRHNDVPILLLTAKGEPADRIAGFEAGADDYLVKPFEPRELLLRIATILRRVSPPEKKPQISFGRFRFDASTGELFDNDEMVYLTTGEAALLTVLAESAGAPISRRDLALRAKIDGADRAVDVQIARLRRKIEADPRQPAYLQTVRGEGYALRTTG